MTSERRVGPSATYLDPSIVEGVDVARGPGSVAYGSDAFGGVISVRTRRVTPGTPLEVRFAGTAGTGIPDRRLTGQISKGLPAGSVLFAAHTREADDWDSPEGEVFNSGFSDHGFLGRVEQQVGTGMISVGWQSDFGRDIERPRNNSRIVRFYYPYEDSHRFTGSYEVPDVGGFKRMHVTTFFGTYDQRTDQDRFATATTGRSIERADIAAKDYGVRAYGERLLGRARVEMGVDLNGRFGLEALDDLITYDLAGDIVSTRPNVSIENAHRTDTGLYASIDTALTSVLSLGAGVRGDYVVTTNTGGYFGDLSTGNGGGSGYAALTAGSFGGFSTTLQVARGFRDPTCRTATIADPRAAGTSPATPISIRRPACSSTVSARYTAPRYRLAAFYYQYRIDDLIERYQTTIDNFFFRNRGRARIRGFEVEGQADLGAGFTVDLATAGGRGPLAGRRRLSGRHVAVQPHHGAAEVLRLARLRPGPAGVLRR